MAFDDVRVYPGSEPAAEEHAAPTPPDSSPSKQPKQGSYVIQVPRDQIYRTPTPETAKRFEDYTRGASRRRSCCRLLLCWTLGLLISLAVAAAVLYLVLRPRLPHFAVEGLTVGGFDLGSSGRPLSPRIDIALRAENPNRKMGIFYREGGTVVVSHSGLELCRGDWPAFYQAAGNVTVAKTSARRSGLRLPRDARSALAAEQWGGAVPLEIAARVPVRFKMGAATTWTVAAAVRCRATVEKLAAGAQVLPEPCGVELRM